MGAVTLESSAVANYLGILQSIINRMATSSASSKAWCIALVSAILVIVSSRSNPAYLWIALVPIVLFFFLDAYYLGLEQRFRSLYNSFVTKLHAGEATIKDVYVVEAGSGFKITLSSTVKAIFSVSVLPFYGLLLAMLWAVHKYIF